MLIQLRRPSERRESTSPIYLSRNSKTEFSINTAIELTCRPTRACLEYCYGKRGPIRFPASQARQRQNAARFIFFENPDHRVEMLQDVDRIASFVGQRQKFLRFFGVGDLSAGSVLFINAMARRHPRLHLWVATRQMVLASTVAYEVNIHLMLSIDATTNRADASGARHEIKKRKSQAFAAWVQQEAQEKVPSWIEVIFAEHRGAVKAPWTRNPGDRRICPATIAGQDGHGACSRCERCFNTTQRALKRR